MSSFFSSVALYLTLALGLILAGAALLSLCNPIIGKLGVRNIPRRPTQSTLIVFGLTLSTMIIVSALSLGDKTIGQAYDLATQQSFPTPWLTIAGMWLAVWRYE